MLNFFHKNIPPIFLLKKEMKYHILQSILKAVSQQIDEMLERFLK